MSCNYDSPSLPSLVICLESIRGNKKWTVYSQLTKMSFSVFFINNYVFYSSPLKKMKATLKENPGLVKMMLENKFTSYCRELSSFSQILAFVTAVNSLDVQKI